MKYVEYFINGYFRKGCVKYANIPLIVVLGRGMLSAWNIPLMVGLGRDM